MQLDLFALLLYMGTLPDVQKGCGMTKRQSKATRVEVELIPKFTDNAKAKIDEEVDIPDPTDGKKIIEGQLENDTGNQR